MAAGLSHLQLNIDPVHAGFYRDLFTHLGWTPLYDADGILGFGAGDGPSVWFVPRVTDAANDYDGPGLNHLALAVTSEEEVDSAARYLAERGIAWLFETPRHRPEFAEGPDETYYQVMFASPDGLLFEVVYGGPKGT